ncbi:transmembrane protein 163-like isoform X2 [Gigantopelta aegis]|uniref:transmembrane protein 163-like isoform X2 n=1 Tax=Gigantopelta aegis TaxID=1735272 RepID=UPI001B88BCAF|nr:transmembrane protein 163-like isoform X2 [Gigantopelta aegis]
MELYMRPVFSSEDVNLSSSFQRRVSFSTASRFRKYAIALSIVSVLFPLSSGIAAIVLSSLKNSQTLFGYGLDAILDSMSSLVVIWRFFGSSTVVYSPTKERMACIVVANLFFVAAACLVGKSAHALAVNLVEDKSLQILIFASVSGIVSVILGTMKVYLGYELESRVLLTDSVITFTGAAIAFANCVGMYALESDERLWIMDPIFGILCGVFLIGFGAKLLVDMTCWYRDPSKMELKDDDMYD